MNLFAYTATASVFAAAGGARIDDERRSVATYLDWARRNLDRNGFEDPARHRLLQEDASHGSSTRTSERYDLIFLDPPTVSRSKRMARSSTCSAITSS